jgi:hypothetical protein
MEACPPLFYQEGQEHKNLIRPRHKKTDNLPKKPKTPSNIIIKMKGVFWNSRGLADLAKHSFLVELVRQEQNNFIALSKTGHESFPDHVLKNLCAKRDFLWHAVAPHGR